MNKITLTVAIFMLFIFKSIGQANPVSNLVWRQDYFMGRYDFYLSWNPPAPPHDELVGYNIYRDNQLFRFQSETYLTNQGVAPNCGQEFMALVSNGDGFDIHVTALYNSGGTESGFVETVYVANNLLSVDGFEYSKAILYPNPTNGLLNIGNVNVKEIVIYDIFGKTIKAFQPQSQINLSDIPKGIYSLKLITDKEISISKIVIQ